MVRTTSALAALLCLWPAMTAAQTCDGSEKANRDVVLAFYEEALVGLKPRAGFERYVAPDFVEHKPDIDSGDREGAIRFLEGLIAEVPEPRWEILRTLADGDHVFLHASFTPAAGAPAYAVADVFRLKDCRIVEHWDVVGPPAGEAKNPHPRF